MGGVSHIMLSVELRKELKKLWKEAEERRPRQRKWVYKRKPGTKPAAFISPWPRYIPSLWPICCAFRVGQVLMRLCLWFHEARF